MTNLEASIWGSCIFDLPREKQSPGLWLTRGQEAVDGRLGKNFGGQRNVPPFLSPEGVGAQGQSHKPQQRVKNKCMQMTCRMLGCPQRQVTPSSTEDYDSAASGRPQDDEKTLWEQGLLPCREANLGTEMEHKNRRPCSNYGICCHTAMLKITYRPQPPPAGRASSPIASTLTGAFMAAF